MSDNRILITGISGLIGEVLYRGLSDIYAVRGLDRRAIDVVDAVTGEVVAPFRDSMLVADTTDLDSIRPAFEGIHTVIDLAAVPYMDTPGDVILSNNLPSTYNVLEAARLGGVKRLVFSSSNHVTGMYENDYPYSAIVAGQYQGLDSISIPKISTFMPIRPDGMYGIGKAFGEAAGRFYYDKYGLSVICLRIGTLNREGRPLIPRHYATLLTHEDLVRLVRSCIEAPNLVGFDVFYGVSSNKWRFWDIDNALESIGYRPEDDAEAWR